MNDTDQLVELADELAEVSKHYPTATRFWTLVIEAQTERVRALEAQLTSAEAENEQLRDELERQP